LVLEIRVFWFELYFVVVFVVCCFVVGLGLESSGFSGVESGF